MERPKRKCPSCGERLNPNAFPKGRASCYACADALDKRMRAAQMPDVLQRLRPLLDAPGALTDWESRFVSDLVERYEAGRIRALTLPMADKLDEIAEKRGAA